jgi:hypothetical protein
LPSKAEHLEKAKHNEFFVSTLGNPFWDWAVTGTFYAALHYIEAYLATKADHPPTHAIRDSHIYRDSFLRVLYVDYRELQGESEDARYMEKLPVTVFGQADVTRLVANLEKIRNHILPTL